MSHGRPSSPERPGSGDGAGSAGIEEVSEGYRRIEWLVQRSLWLLILGLPAAALLGLLGGTGPLACRDAVAGELSVRHARIAREGGRASLLVRSPAPSGDLSISGTYLDAFDIDRVTPEPSEEIVEGDRRIFRFAEPAPARVEMTLVPRRLGSVEGTARWTGSADASFSTLVLP